MLWPNWVCFDRKLEIKSVVKTIVMNVMPDLILDIVPNMPHIYIYTHIHTYTCLIHCPGSIGKSKFCCVVKIAPGVDVV